MGLALLLLYLLSLCPTIYSGDAAELATAGSTFGIPHPPGYPLYTLMANIWSRALPVGEVAWRINLLSAASGASGAVLVFLLLHHLRAGLTAAVFAALGLGVGITYWSQAIISEVYAFDILLAALTLFAAVRARIDPTLKRAALVMACWGLWIGHRNVNLIYTPAVLILAWPALRVSVRSARSMLVIGSALLLPLMVLIYLPLASSFDPPLDTGDPESWSRFWSVVTAQVYRQYLQGGFSWDNLLVILSGLLRELGLALVLAPLGLVVCWKKHRAATMALGYLALANWLFVACYAVPDVRVFTLPSLLGLSALAGLAAAWVLERLRATWLRVLLLSCLAPLWAINWGDNNIRAQTLVHDFAFDALSYPEKKGLVLSHVDTVSFSLWYVQFVERHRPDLLVVSKGRAVDWHQEQARRLRPDLDIPLYDGPLSAIRWPSMLLQRNQGRVSVYVTANLGGYFGPQEATRLAARFEEVPAGLLTQLVAKDRLPVLSSVIERNQGFWQDAWPHAVKARGQRLDTEMAALLLHYASMRILFARFALWHGAATPAGNAARAVLELNPGPVIMSVNRAYARQGARYHMSDMPEIAASIRDLADNLERERITLAQVRQRLAHARADSPREPPQVQRLNQQGIRLAQQGDLAAGLTAFEHALELMPDHRGALFNRAKVLASLGRNSEAIVAYEHLLRLSPNNLAALLGLSELKLAEDPTRAVRLLERAASSPGPEPLRELARKRLMEIRGMPPAKP